MRLGGLAVVVEGRLWGSAMGDTIDAEMARQLSRAGGFGVADAIARASETASSGSPDEAAGTGTTIPAPVDHTRPVEDRLTSPFGWRADPLTGAARFHTGIDLRAAYGDTVPAAAPGRVVEAQERGGYGLTVVVEHGPGLRTRYAHLSAMTVAVGDTVDQGQEIGRVGQSGRATGPHLHFEVIRNGERVDPTALVALRGTGTAGLKLAGLPADYQIGTDAAQPAPGESHHED
jgi:murein DD-endopeptidase MepM/ murein hydrolase activator NlpD